MQHLYEREPEIHKVLTALAQPTRLAMLREIAQRPSVVGELAELLGLRQQTISYHMSMLVEARLVQIGTVYAQFTSYILDEAGLELVVSCVQQELLRQEPRQADNDSEPVTDSMLETLLW